MPVRAARASRARGGILVGSRHTGESLWAAMDDPTVEDRTRLGPPGRRRRAVHAARPGRGPGRARAPARAAGDARARRPRTSRSFARSPGEAAAALATIEPDDRLVVFVGKLIASKGVELLLAAWPLVLAREPRARLLVVGFGAFRAGLEGLAAHLGGRRPRRGAGPAQRARRRAAAPGRLPRRARGSGRLPRGGPRHDGPDRLGGPARPLRAARRAAGARRRWRCRARSRRRSAWSPPRPRPAAHCRWWPRTRGSPRSRARSAPPHPEAARGWLTFEVGPGAVRELAGDLSAWLEAPDDLRAATRDAIVAATRESYSWDGVARSVIAAARGELDGLPRPAASSKSIRIRALHEESAVAGGDRRGRGRSSAAAISPTPGPTWSTARSSSWPSARSCHVLAARRRDRRRRPQPRPGVPARPQGRLRREHVRGPRPRADPAPGHQPAGRPRDRARGR